MIDGFILTCVVHCAGLGLANIDGKRRRNGGGLVGATRSVEQCEREIQRLQASVDNLRHKLEESDLRDSNNDLFSMSNHSDTKMKSIISRLVFCYGYIEGTFVIVGGTISDH